MARTKCFSQMSPRIMSSLIHPLGRCRSIQKLPTIGSIHQSNRQGMKDVGSADSRHPMFGYFTRMYRSNGKSATYSRISSASCSSTGFKLGSSADPDAAKAKNAPVSRAAAAAWREVVGIRRPPVGVQRAACAA